MKTKTNKILKILNSINKKTQRTIKCIINFINQTFKNYKTMKKKLSKIWACMAIIGTCAIATSCNVTRVVTNKSEYSQRGDTAIVIQTKITETYNAQKN